MIQSVEKNTPAETAEIQYGDVVISKMMNLLLILANARFHW